ncbi:hypothetical protein AB0C29_00325 [Actinoplanes sp. NPDC048791]|uniref:hypothetical protein n=1 Tax=Actinoplanes sp. NPDC048791 TaxID=3154623 RepID=UPI003408D0A3
MVKAGNDVQTYWDWQRKLAETLVTKRSGDEPFVFFVDDEEIARLWPDLAEPVDSLRSAVCRQLHWQSGESLFRPLEKINRDRPAETIPLTLPVLAVSVLAASRMRRDAAFHGSAYFIRLAQALRPELTGAHLEEVRQRLSGGFGVVASFWQEFDRWIRHSGEYGSSTIQEHAHLKRIGFPLSQALLRESDRMLLTGFFDALDLSEQGVPSAAALTSALRIWTSRSRGLSETFLFALSDPTLCPVVTDEVARLARNWDRVVRSPGGKRRLDMRVVIDLDDLTARWTAACLPEVASDRLKMMDGRSFTVTTPEWGSQYMISGAPPPADLTGRRVHAQGDLCSAVVQVPEVFAARENADAGGWVAADGIEPREEHLLIVAAEFDAAVTGLLEEAAEDGWKQLPQRTARALLPGHSFYRRVRLSSPAAFERGISGLSPKLMRALRPETPPRPRLVNGLKVASNLGSRHYLRGGEPDLLLPASPETRAVAVSLDGAEQHPPFRATGFAIPLRSVAGPLAAGQHEVIADGDRLVFHIHDTTDCADSPSTIATLGWHLTSESAQLTSLGPFDVAGADTSGSCREPQLLRRISDWHVVDRHGRSRKLSVPAPAAWTAALGLPSSQFYEFTASPDDVWLIEFRHGSARKPELLRWQDPIAKPVDAADRAIWNAISDFAASDRLLSHFLKVLQP